MCPENKTKQNSSLQVSSIHSKQQRTHGTPGTLRVVLISRTKQRQGNELITITKLAQFPQCYAVCSVTEHGGLGIQLQLSGVKFHCQFLRNGKQEAEKLENQIVRFLRIKTRITFSACSAQLWVIMT